MDRENGNNGNTVLLTVIGVATLLVALVGATFAYFSATITNDAKESVIISTAAPVGLEYLGKTISIENAIPGDSDNGTFTVKNPDESAVAQTYDLDLIIDTNEFTTAAQANNGYTFTDADNTALLDQLNITITAASSGTTTMQSINSGNAYNLTDGSSSTKTYKLVDDQRIEIGETQTYTLQLDFKELNIPQDANQGKNFAAHIEISDPQSVR